MPIGRDVLRAFERRSTGPEGSQAFRALWADHIIWFDDRRAWTARVEGTRIVEVWVHSFDQYGLDDFCP